MAEHALAAFDAVRRERLAALGLELLTLRSTPVAVSGVNSGAGITTPRSPAQTPASRPRLVLRGAAASAADANDAALLRSILSALGLGEGDVVPEPVGDLPVLAFGADLHAGAIVAPALPQLRDARVKRTLWPQLRRLRRQLRDSR